MPKQKFSKIVYLEKIHSVVQ